MPKEDMENRFLEEITSRGLLEKDDAVLVGVSGGADSVALLQLLWELNQKQGWSLQLHIAHLNHQLRGEDAEEDARFVEALAERCKLPFTAASVDVRQHAEQAGLSIEQAARHCRFEFFERLCLQQGIKKLALAHHADDNAETVLHRIIRGTGLRGLVGIRAMRRFRPESELQIIRPMLGLRREEINEYLRERKLEYRTDHSNESLQFTRNHIRHEVLPLLETHFNPQVIEALNRLAEQAEGVDDFLTETSQRILQSLLIDRNDRQLCLHAPSLVRRPRIMQTQLIRQAILLLDIPEGEINYGHLNAVADLAAETEGTKSLDLPAGLRVTRRYTRLVFERSNGEKIPCEAEGEVHVSVSGKTPLRGCGLELEIDSFESDEKIVMKHIHDRRIAPGKVSWEEWVDMDCVHPPLIARRRRPGDRFFPLGMSGMKKIKDFLIDEKIDAHLREQTVVLCDQLGPIWIVPFRIDERVRMTSATNHVLRLRAHAIKDVSAD
jgi:tRNA(Ile)-lysidine synthase